MIYTCWRWAWQGRSLRRGVDDGKRNRICDPLFRLSGKRWLPAPMAKRESKRCWVLRRFSASIAAGVTLCHGGDSAPLSAAAAGAAPVAASAAAIIFSGVGPGQTGSSFYDTPAHVYFLLTIGLPQNTESK